MKASGSASCSPARCPAIVLWPPCWPQRRLALVTKLIWTGPSSCSFRCFRRQHPHREDASPASETTACGVATEAPAANRPRASLRLPVAARMPSIAPRPNGVMLGVDALVPPRLDDVGLVKDADGAITPTGLVEGAPRRLVVAITSVSIGVQCFERTPVLDQHRNAPAPKYRLAAEEAAVGIGAELAEHPAPSRGRRATSA